MNLRVDVIFDVAETSPYFAPTLDAVAHAAVGQGAPADVRVVRTDTITSAYVDDLPDAVVIGPGTPYTNPSAAEAVIARARDGGVPLVGT